MNSGIYKSELLHVHEKSEVSWEVGAENRLLYVCNDEDQLERST